MTAGKAADRNVQAATNKNKLINAGAGNCGSDLKQRLLGNVATGTACKAKNMLNFENICINCGRAKNINGIRRGGAPEAWPAARSPTVNFTFAAWL